MFPHSASYADEKKPFMNEYEEFVNNYEFAMVLQATGSPDEYKREGITTQQRLRKPPKGPFPVMSYMKRKSRLACLEPFVPERFWIDGPSCFETARGGGWALWRRSLLQKSIQLEIK